MSRTNERHMSKASEQQSTQELASRITKLEQENMQFREELATLRTKHTSADAQPSPLAAGVSFTADGTGNAAVTATGTHGARAVVATGDTGECINGTSTDYIGVVGESVNGTGIYAQTHSDVNPALFVSYLGSANAPSKPGGVFAEGQQGDGVIGSTISSAKSGVFGRNDSTATTTPPAGSGVFGLTLTTGGVGVFGANNNATSGRGVHGNGPEAGVGGFSPAGQGVVGQSNKGAGVVGTCVEGIAIVGQAPTAGHFIGKVKVDGDMEVSGDVILTGGADCAEEFDVAEAVDVEPGTVIVLDQDGVLHQGHQAYDKRVAGVISGAGDYRPGLILAQQQSHASRVPVALVGKVYCKVDAQYAPIEVGDLLTTSPTPGHAMRASDPLKAFGAVIGKALSPFDQGCGLIPILVALQ